MIYYCVYKSEISNDIILNDHLGILEKSKVNNKRNDITGALVTTPTSFIQYIEGTKESVWATYDKICQDPRHQNIQLLDDGYTEQRCFPNWKMAFRSISQVDWLTNENSDSPTEFIRNLSNSFDSSTKELTKDYLQDIVLANIEDVVTIFDANLTRLYISPSIEKLVGISSSEMLRHHPDDHIHPLDIQRTKKELADFINKNESKGTVSYRMRHYDGYYNWVEVVYKIVYHEDASVQLIIATARNISNRKLVEDEDLPKTRLLEGLAKSNTVLLSDGQFEDQVYEAFKIIGDAFTVDRMGYYENNYLANGNILTNKRVDWIAKENSPRTNNAEFQNLPLTNFGSFFEPLSKGKTFHGLTNNFEPMFQQLLRTHSVQSILVIPIIINNKFYGFVGIEHCLKEHIWSELEHTVFESFVLSLKSVVARIININEMKDLK